MSLPILYSFRRCPYAMRARLALYFCGIDVERREVALKHKPEAMLRLSPKRTVPVMQLPSGEVIDESLDICLWALGQPLSPAKMPFDPILFYGIESEQAQLDLIASSDNGFKYWLDRYKYHVGYPDHPQDYYRAQAMVFLNQLEARLLQTDYLFGDSPGLADIAIFPFVRQFAFVDFDWFDAEAGGRLQAWLQSWLDHPAFAAVMIKSEPWDPANI